MKIISLFLLSVVTIFSASSSIAANNRALILNPMNGEKTLSVVQTMNIYGQCGGTAIIILGMLSDGSDDFNNQDNFTLDGTGSDLLLSNEGSHNISLKDELDNFNTVQCVSTKNGSRLLVGSSCSGSSCIDEFDYTIIEPKNGRKYPIKSHLKRSELCDKKCANQALGFNYLK